MRNYGVRYRERGVTAVAYVTGESAEQVCDAFKAEYPARKVIAVWSRGEA